MSYKLQNDLDQNVRFLPVTATYVAVTGRNVLIVRNSYHKYALNRASQI